MRNAKIAPDQSEEDRYTDHLMNVAQRIRSYRLPVQTVAVDEYEQVAEIFNRVNTGGRRLSKGDLVMGTLAARWKNGRKRIEDFELELDQLGWRLNREVLLRIMSVISAGGPNHIRLVELKDEGDWRRGWEQTETAVRHAIEFLERDADIANLSLLPSEYLVLAPAVILHRQHGRFEAGQANELRRWVYLAGAFCPLLRIDRDDACSRSQSCRSRRTRAVASSGS